jgi:hypothetical protein
MSVARRCVRCSVDRVVTVEVGAYRHILSIARRVAAWVLRSSAKGTHYPDMHCSLVDQAEGGFVWHILYIARRVAAGGGPDPTLHAA